MNREPLTTSPLDATAFTAEVVRLLCKALPDLSIEVVADLQYLVGLADPLQSNLQNGYHDYLGGMPLETVAEKRVEQIRELMAIKPAQASDILPVLRGPGYGTAISQKNAENNEPDLHYDFGHGLAVFYIRNTPTSIMSMRASTLAEAGVSIEDLAQVALTNLRRYRQGKVQFEQVADQPIYLVSLDGDYDSSLLLDEDFWTTEKLPLTEPYLAFVPNRGTLLIASMSSNEAVLGTQHLAQRSFEDRSYPLTPHPFIRNAGEWIPVKIEAEDEAK